MFTPEDRKFQDQLEAKKIIGHKADRAANTDKIVKKMDELKPQEVQKMELVNESNELAKAFFSMLKGEKGDVGEQGEQGEKGEKGDRGADSIIPGPKGERGLSGKNGVNGKDGADGDDGKDGVNGINGKDGSPDTGFVIKQKLESLTGTDRLKLESIQGVDEFERSLITKYQMSREGAFVPRSLSALYDVDFSTQPTDGQYLIFNAATKKWKAGTIATGAGTGSVTSVSVVTANGVSGSVATATTTPAITLTLGAITPSSVVASGSVTGSNLSGTNTGDITLGTANGLSLTGQALSLPTSATPQFTRLGLGQAADASAVMAATGQYFSAKFTCTTTLDWNNSNVQYIVLANNGQTFTFANPKDGARYLLVLKQPASGAAGTVTWPATVLWPAGSAPTLTVTNGKVDIITFVYDGTNTKYYAGSNLNY